MDEFLKEWYGILAFVLFDFAALVLIISITYRWFFKRIFDFLVSIVCIAATSPILLWIYVRARKAKKQGEIEQIFQAEPFIGKKGKTIFLRRFNGDFGKCAALARLFDLFLGRVSVIGYEPLSEAECEDLTEVEFDRHITKPGLINPHFTYGGSKEDKNAMLKTDEKYAWNFSFFGDIKIFFKWLLKKIRGQN